MIYVTERGFWALIHKTTDFGWLMKDLPPASSLLLIHCNYIISKMRFFDSIVNNPYTQHLTLVEFLKYLLTGLIMYGCFMAIECVRPVERHQPMSHIWFNLKWYILYNVIIRFLIQGAGIGVIVSIAQDWLRAPWIDLPQPQGIFGYAIAALFYFLVTDFFYYWFHRWQHKTSFLWEQHKLHHSEQSLNVTSTWRVHWLEEPLIIIFLALPMGLLFQFNGLQLGLLSFAHILWLQFIHMNLKIELGWFSKIMTGPQYHRIHHSFQTKHLDKNFAAFFPIFDLLFGTYYHPRRHEFPATGLEDGSTYNNLWQATILPFQQWSRSFILLFFIPF